MVVGDLSVEVLQELRDVSMMAEQTLLSVAQRRGFVPGLSSVETIENQIWRHLVVVQFLTSKWMDWRKSDALLSKAVMVEELVTLCDSAYAEVLPLAQTHGFAQEMMSDEALEHDLYALLSLLQWLSSCLLQPSLRKPLVEQRQALSPATALA